MVNSLIYILSISRICALIVVKRKSSTTTVPRSLTWQYAGVLPELGPCHRTGVARAPSASSILRWFGGNTARSRDSSPDDSGEQNGVVYILISLPNFAKEIFEFHRLLWQYRIKFKENILYHKSFWYKSGLEANPLGKLSGLEVLPRAYLFVSTADCCDGLLQFKLHNVDMRGRGEVLPECHHVHREVTFCRPGRHLPFELLALTFCIFIGLKRNRIWRWVAWEHRLNWWRRQNLQNTRSRSST